MATFYKTNIETYDNKGAVLKSYTFNDKLFSLVNKQYQKALKAAKSSGAVGIVAELNRHNNGHVSSVVYFER